MPISRAEFDHVRDLLLRSAGIVLEEDKAYRVESCLSTLARAERMDSVSDLIARLRTSPENGLHRRVVESMTVNETSFFRDLHPFDALRKHVLPELIERRAHERRLSIWCAGCSTGQEPVSIALLIREHAPQLLGWDVRLQAGDLCAAALDRARRGIYSRLEVNRGLPAALLVKYFKQHGIDWQLRDEVLRSIDYQHLNLAETWTIQGSLDVVFIRNVLIYFDLDVRRRVLERIHRLLRPDGVLFLGGAESTMMVTDLFERVPFERQAYYRPRSS